MVEIQALTGGETTTDLGKSSAISAFDKTMFIANVVKSVDYAPHMVSWVPGTTFAVCLGSMQSRPTSIGGTVRVYQLKKGSLDEYGRMPFGDTSVDSAKCMTLVGSNPGRLILGTHGGHILLQDLASIPNERSATEAPSKPLVPLNRLVDKEGVTGGNQIVQSDKLGYCVNSVDSPYYMQDLVAAGYSDGIVRVFDIRTPSAPVMRIRPKLNSDSAQLTAAPSQVWSVAFCDGTRESEGQLHLAVGYDSGDIKIFDVRKSELIVESSTEVTPEPVSSSGARNSSDSRNSSLKKMAPASVNRLAYDRPDSISNKLYAASMSGLFLTYDCRTNHPIDGYARLATVVEKKGTVWGCYPLPQDREVVACLVGSSAIVYRYSYPNRRQVKEEDGSLKGAVGTLEQLGSHEFSDSPAISMSWHPNKAGLGLFASLDQKLSVMVVTKLS